MPLEGRIREELGRAAETIETNVERNLGAVEARAHRRDGVSASLLAVAAVVIVLAIAIRLGGGTNQGTAGSAAPSPALAAATPSPTGSLSPAIYPQIAGTYKVTLDTSNAAVVRDGLAGQWTLRLQPDGVALLSAPQAFQPGASSLTGITYALTGDRFRTDLFYNDFCSSIGTYAWSLANGRLAFTPVDETCPVRRTLLSTVPWEAGK